MPFNISFHSNREIVMSTAKYYTYRNLHTGGFSTKHRGKVILRFNSGCICAGARFQVSQSGNSRARNEKKRNVHAYIVSSEVPTILPDDIAEKLLKYLRKFSYKPFKDNSFMVDSTPVTSERGCVMFDGKCYI